MLCALVLCLLSAAREVGMDWCLWIHSEDHLESVALFPFQGRWWFYLPSVGSYETTVPAAQPPPIDLFDPSLRCRVLPEPRTADLLNGCLPRAIAEVRQKGGRVRITRGLAGRVGHAERVP